MSITRTVQQQYENYIAVKNGPLDLTMCLTFTAPLADTATGVVRGSVVSLNDNGKMVLGLTEGSGNKYPMPMFAKKNAFDPDVQTGAVGASTGKTLATALTGGLMTAYVATGAYELESSEYDKDGAYTVNTALVCSTAANKVGKVTPATKSIYDTTTVLGIVSQVPFRSKASFDVNGTGNNRICFWPVFFPPTRA